MSVVGEALGRPADVVETVIGGPTRVVEAALRYPEWPVGAALGRGVRAVGSALGTSFGEFGAVFDRPTGRGVLDGRRPPVRRQFFAARRGLFESDLRSVERFHRYEPSATGFFDGVVPVAHAEAVAALRDSGFAVSLLSYPKYLAGEAGSVEAVDSTWVFRPQLLADSQVHVDLFERYGPDGDPVCYVFSHREPNCLRHPVDHLSRTGVDPVGCRETVVDLLESAGLAVRTCPDLEGRYPEACRYCVGGEAGA